MLFSCISLALYIILGNALSTIDDMVVHESRHEIPKGFVYSGPAPANEILNMSVALVQGNISHLERVLYEVSDPSSPLYSHHLSKKEVDENFVRPSSETTTLVKNWFTSNGIAATPASDAGDWLSVSMPIGKANALFNTTFSTFIHSDSGKVTVRTLNYSIPARLNGSLEFVHPTINFPDFDYNGKASAMISGSKIFVSRELEVNEPRPAISPFCENIVPPECLQQLYNIPREAATQSSNRIAVTGLLSQYANMNDLQHFIQDARPDLLFSNNTFSVETIDGGQNLQDPSLAGSEANLDIQYTVGLATGVPVTFISVGPRNTDGLQGFLDLVNYVLGQNNPAQVLTSSYNADEAYYSRALSQRVCNAYMQLGVRGVSVIFSSGDGGVSGTRINRNCATFVPTFPSGCPYVTIVGSTANIPETASNYSAGGFSNYFSIPSYQQGDVSSYINSIGSPYTGRFNTRGRGYPDVAVQGEKIFTVSGGLDKSIVGNDTSASAPIFASIIALLNDRLVASNRSTLGFLNPFLYGSGRNTFNDITTGQQGGCVTGGFPVKTGWDPVTGLGTPDFERLLAALGL